MAATKEKSKQLSFYTKGPEFTNLLRAFISEGNFKRVYKVLLEGGVDMDVVKQFFRFKLKFEGDTREEGGLSLVDDNENHDLSKIYATAISTAESVEERIEIWKWKDFLDKEDPAFKPEFAFIIEKIFTLDELRDIAATEVLRRSGYDSFKFQKLSKVRTNGVIIRDGSYVPCGFQDHVNLYPMLFQLGLASSSCWTDDSWTFHVTEGQISGSLIHELKRPKLHKYTGTQEQVDGLFFYRNHIRGEYGSFNASTSAEIVRRYVNESEDMGAKYGNLAFLKRFYKKINLPKFSKEKMKGKVCLRTSPLHSMPGLLTSKFNLNENSVKEMEQEFNEVLKIASPQFDSNELRYFYQEYLEGFNGVCHFMNNKFSYQCSETREDVVKGIVSVTNLSDKATKKLHAIAQELSDDLKSPVQLEFVAQGDKVYIVQLRLLRNNPTEYGVKYEPHGEILVNGKTFSTGSEYAKAEPITLNDILIVNSEAQSKDLLGKKALIVEEDVEFSHVLALSKALGIPSLFATGKVDLEKLKGKQLYFVAKHEDGWVTEWPK